MRCVCREPTTPIFSSPAWKAGLVYGIWWKDWHSLQVQLIKKFLTAIFLFSIWSLFASCITEPKQAVLRQLPSMSIDVNLAWEIVIETIREFYPDLDITDKQQGVIKSAWVVTDECWVGLSFGGTGPCERERFVALVSTSAPLDIQIAVEKQKNVATKFGDHLVRHWIMIGNNNEKEQIIYDKLMFNLKLSFQNSVMIDSARRCVVWDLCSDVLKF